MSKYGTFINAIMVDAIKKREGIVSSCDGAWNVYFITLIII